ncbi:molybdopterin biosynthesis protein [Pseudorhodobacter sp. E13]|uniref:molybdopterin-binding protein n=1 Tax=Pseudorhodobacter sp. E13 TaxID=2487931 RepID=UPI000F8DE8CB|nr:molybdopterin-binding protein [Pseudorhodobacter sp. E13]RUS59998.1 molybdopterin biosynthesis protein [Pseudorhodobacter sp. E13]
MEFGEVPTDQAAGAILAHSEALPGGGRLRKGIPLGPEEIARLHAAGITSVTVARLGPDDLHEDAAAMAVARALVPDPEAAGLELRAMRTGRVNILAKGPGVVRLNAKRIHQMNAAEPMITLATVPPWQRMEAGGMVGTIKIIAYAVPQQGLARACALGADAISLRPPVLRRAVLIQTSVGEEDGVKGHRVTEARLSRLGVTLAPCQIVPHRVAELSQALRAAKAADLILILTGSATSDIRDTAPEALREAGGRVLHFGMPVDPGNLLFIGKLGRVPVIGLPGCAKSPALNGADWVMERIICGVPVTPRSIAAMGVGGLLKEIPTRPRPREGT